MKPADLDINKIYSYADYLQWNFDERVELIKGKIFRMAPAPNTNHQRISGSIFTSIYYFLKGQNCEVFSAPCDVRFPHKSKDDKDIITVLQPDIFLVCDPTKIDQRGCIGAPDIIIEILSPSNNKRELKYKHEIYEEAEVKEYWIVDPHEKCQHVYHLTNGQLLAAPLYAEDKLTTNILPGFEIDLAEMFDKV